MLLQTLFVGLKKIWHSLLLPEKRNDIQLLKNWVMRKKMNVQSHRDINNIDYWQKSSDMMIQNYMDKPKEVEIREKRRDEKSMVYISKISPNSILEVGCGFGYTLKKVHSTFPEAEIYGSDFSSNLIDLAKKHLEGCVSEKNLIVADATYIAHLYKPKQFDLLITKGCLMCLTSAQVAIALQEFKKISHSILLIEPDYSHMSLMERLRFKKERNYPVNDYKKLIKRAGNLRLIEEDSEFHKDRLVTNVTFFHLEVISDEVY